MQLPRAAFTLARPEKPVVPCMSPRLIAFSIALATAFVAGCDQIPPGPAVSAPPISNATAQEGTSNEDAGQGNGYVFHIRYPQLQEQWLPLEHALHVFAAAQKKDFLDARVADEHTDTPAYSLDLEFNIARRTADFVSVLSNGSVYMGGAHPNPILVSFNLHSTGGKLIAIDDLFADPTAALKALSDESRRQLEGRYDATPQGENRKQSTADRQQMYAWIERGTEPKADSFKVFLVDGLDSKAIGLTLIFPPYQVASYADGPQQIEVPAKVFYAFLKPEYRDSFAIEATADKITPGAH
jgi:Protein of unknown function (DUF3298)